MGKAYLSKMKGGFIFNKLLKKPNAKGVIIYNIIEKESTFFESDLFLPMWDSTDHLHFACQKCKSVADVLRIKFNKKYSKPPNPRFALFFYLGCPNCGASGQRKIYLDFVLTRWPCQIAFDENKIYVYGEGRKPVRVINVGAKQPEGERD